MLQKKTYIHLICLSIFSLYTFSCFGQLVDQFSVEIKTLVNDPKVIPIPLTEGDLSKFEANKFNYGLHLFLEKRLGDIAVGLGVGGLFRDYGVNENSSQIVYFSLSTQVQLLYHYTDFLFFYGFAGVEIARPWQERYINYNQGNTNSSPSYLFSIHTNDMIASNLGLGAGLLIGERWKLMLGLGYNRQIDNFDNNSIDERIGANSFNIGLRYAIINNI